MRWVAEGCGLLLRLDYYHRIGDDVLVLLYYYRAHTTATTIDMYWCIMTSITADVHDGSSSGSGRTMEAIKG